MLRHALPLLLLGACSNDALEDFLGPERNCDVRSAFYPDADGDGVGEPGVMFIGCEAPDGYTAQAPPSDWPGEPDDTDAGGSDTDDTGNDSGDTDAQGAGG